MLSSQTTPRLGVIGGSGLYEMDGLANVRRTRVASPFGEPSDELVLAELDGVPVAFLPRHGRGHRITPGEVNYRANIDALKRVGVTDLLALSAVGSLREDLHPGMFVIPDQFIDRTFARVKTFFGTGLVAHVSMARPVCGRLGDLAEAAIRDAGVPCTRGGVHLVMEGIQFSTRAESELYRSWGCAIIGMTNMPEAKLAREAELCYAAVAMVTDYDCWHPDHEAVTVDEVLDTMAQNVAAAQRVVRGVAARLATRPVPCPQRCDRSLDAALVTAPEARDPELVARLDAVAGRLL
ncbi:MAG TPA: S-methyl-5'-thioadenosine phosphorylase [Gemmatimonadales bacterium]|nr:S-methyl-5'-thioadenosine phosphorylase [Gemmatimonadales bacterium]